MVCKFNEMKIHWVRNVVQVENPRLTYFSKKDKKKKRTNSKLFFCSFIGLLSTLILQANNDQNTKMYFNLILETIEIRNS